MEPIDQSPSLNLTKLAILLLRISLGWVFLYAGISKIMDPAWSAAYYLNQATTFSTIYQWFASGSNIGWVNFVNQWGQLLIGFSLISGLAVRLSSAWGIILMVLYYFPTLSFPYAGELNFLIDQHIIYALLLLLFIVNRAGRYVGLDYYLYSRIKSLSKIVSWIA